MTEPRLRDAFARLAAIAPDIDDLRLDSSHVRLRLQARRDRRLRVSAVVAFVVLVATLAGFLAARTTHSVPRPAAPIPSSERWTFGPNSLPGYRMTAMDMYATRQDFTYAATNARAVSPVQVTVVAETSQLRAALAGLAVVPIGEVQGRSGELRGTACDQLYGDSSCPTPVAAWPVDGNRWAIMPGVVSITTPLPIQLLALARTMKPAYEPNVSFVKLPYLPPHMRLTFFALDVNVPPLNGMGAVGSVTMSFSYEGYGNGAQVNVSIPIHTDLSLPNATADTLASQVHAGPWERTTVQGHLAWRSSTDYLIQWGKLLVIVDNGNSIPHELPFPATPMPELMKVVDTMSVAGSDVFGDGYPLNQALPDGVGW